MPRAQKRTLISLSVIALTVAMAALYTANATSNPPINLTPLVTIFTSAIPILTLWWPFRPKYRSERLKDIITIDLHNGETGIFGKGEALFRPTFATNSPTSVHLITRYHPDLRGSAITKDINRFEELKDVRSYELSDRDKSPNINDIVILKNRFEIYALMRIVEITSSKGNTAGTEVRIEYVINPSGGTNFS